MLKVQLQYHSRIFTQIPFYNFINECKIKNYLLEEAATPFSMNEMTCDSNLEKMAGMKSQNTWKLWKGTVQTCFSMVKPFLFRMEIKVSISEVNLSFLLYEIKNLLL